MRFEFVTSARIIFGNGTVHEVGALARTLGRKVLLVRGAGSVSPGCITKSLEEKSIAYETFQVSHEPDVGLIEKGIRFAKESACDMVVGFGGGSVLDTGKAIAAMLTNPGELMDYLEGVGKGQQTELQSAPMIAIPTTAGTGSEVTRNAVISSPEHKIKVSMRSAAMIPRIALVDPELTHSMPPSIRAASGMDALTQLIEGYTSNAANAMTDGLAREGVMRAGRSLRTAYSEPDNASAREDMAIASLLSGLVLANGGLGAVHGFAGVIGGLFQTPHGAICGCLLPAVMRINIEACKGEFGNSDCLSRYQEIAEILTHASGADALEGVAWVDETSGLLKIPKLASFGITSADHSKLISQSRNTSNMKKNPIALTDEMMLKILKDS